MTAQVLEGTQPPWGGRDTIDEDPVPVDVREPNTLEHARAIGFRTESGGPLMISWDGGSTYPTSVPAGTSFGIANIYVKTVHLKSQAGFCTYEFIARERP